MTLISQPLHPACISLLHISCAIRLILNLLIHQSIKTFTLFAVVTALNVWACREAAEQKQEKKKEKEDKEEKKRQEAEKKEQKEREKKEQDARKRFKVRGPAWEYQLKSI